jgi:hypothetical protein
MAEAVHSLFEEDETELDSLQPDPDLTDSDLWRLFERDFLKKPGEHLLGLGITGSGKTQKAYFLLKKLIPYETVVWFDTGKDYDFDISEIAPLFTFGVPINIIAPLQVEGKEIRVEVSGSPVEVTVNYAAVPGRIWDLIRPGMINIVMISRFYMEPDAYAKYTAQAFKELIMINKAEKHRLKSVIPMSIFHDEFADVAPGSTMSLSESHTYSAKLMSFNINKLRSNHIRILGFTQDYTMIMRKCRVAFTWILCCRGAYFEREHRDLAKFNDLYKKLDIWQGIMWFPKRVFKHRWRFPLYKGPEGLSIRYEGI